MFPGYIMKLSVKLVAQNNEFIANCPELDISCYGADRGEAIRRIHNVLFFYIQSAKELGLEIESFDSISIEGEQKSIVDEDGFLPAIPNVH